MTNFFLNLNPFFVFKKSGANSERVKGIFVFAATIIGAGILALPVSLAEAGFWPGMAMIILVGVICLFAGLFIAESYLRAGEGLHLPGLAYKFLGKWGLWTMLLGILLCVWAALTGYLSGGGQVIYDISQGIVPVKLGILIYFSLGTFLIYSGIKAVKSASFFMFLLMVALFLVLLGFTFSHLDLTTPTLSNWSATPGILGILIFAFGGHTVITSLGESMKKDAKGLKIICILGVLLPLIFYLLWFFGVSFVVPYGAEAPEAAHPLLTETLSQAKAFGQPATIPLAHFVGGQILIWASFFALFSIFTSFLGFGISTKDCLVDFSRKRLKEIFAICLVVGPPLVFSLIHPTSFLSALEIAGLYGDGIFMGLLPPLILLRSRKLGEKIPGFVTPGGKIIPILVFLFFAFAMIHKTISFFL